MQKVFRTFRTSAGTPVAQSTVKEGILQILGCDEQTLIDAIAISRGHTPTINTNVQTVAPTPSILLPQGSQNRIYERQQQQAAHEVRTALNIAAAKTLGIITPAPAILLREAK